MYSKSTPSTDDVHPKNRDGVLRFAWYIKGNPLKVHHVHHFLEGTEIRHTTLTCARVCETLILLYLLYFHTVLPGKRGETVYTIGVHGRSHTLMALTLRARSPVRMSSRPGGALYSCSSSRPQGAVLDISRTHPEHTPSAPRSQVTSRQSQPTRDQTPFCPALPA